MTEWVLSTLSSRNAILIMKSSSEGTPIDARRAQLTTARGIFLPAFPLTFHTD
jgi:hypothetical protein